MESSARNRSAGRADILALGFGTAVAMWFVGYVGRLPGVAAPPAALGVLMLLCLFAGGVFAGRLGPRGWRGGVYCGLLAGALNLLILGSLLAGDAPNDIVPSKLLWLPGSLLASMLIAAIGAAIGRFIPLPLSTPRSWHAAFASVALVATLLLMAVGGMVTGQEAGLAVPDWPNSYGYNMFLYPLSRMSGGIYFEHAHRLFGSLVGLTTLVFAVYTQSVEKRTWVRTLAWSALAAVIVQGLMGGLRVTGRLTLDTSADAMTPNLTLAILHGIFAHVFLGMLVVLRSATGTTWLGERAAAAKPSAGTDRVLSHGLVAAVLVQLTLGALLRHVTWGLNLHIGMAALVTLLAVATGIRAWGIYDRFPVLPKLGVILLGLTGVQLTLGFVALVAIGGEPPGNPTATQAAITTLHQTVGALLLACSVALAVWNRRLLRPGHEPHGISVDASG